jgi:hypothetical protein
MVGYGLGFVLIIVGILSLVLSFHLKLHSINEDPIVSKTWFGFSKTKTLVSLIMGVVLSTDVFFDTEEMFLTYLRINCVMILYIIIPRYGMIEPNRNFELYFSIYHHQPPPVLPWQLPTNFDPNSVKLIVVSSK